jgi:hypothetical protein
MSQPEQETTPEANSGALQAIPEGNFDIVETKRAGRPSKFTPELIKKLMAAIADGLNIKQACMAVGIGETTLHDWRQEIPELEAQLEEARERCRKKALAGIKAAGEAGDWRALEAFLRMSFPAEYRRDASVNVNASATVQQGVVISEEKRRELQEKLRRLQDQTS